MKKKIVVSILTGLCACLMSAAFSACGGGAKHTHEYDEKWTSNATYHWHECECGEKDREENHTAGAPATATTPQTCTVCGYVLQAETGILFNTLTVDGTKAYGKVSNDTTEFSFIDEVTVKGDSKFVVALDKNGMQTVVTKTVTLQEGDNEFYVFETLDGDVVNDYEVTIRRRPMHEVTFNANGGTAVEKQVIEEDYLATEPETTRIGYTFTGWDYDFTKPITETMKITANWSANKDTKYTVNYYLQNLNDTNYTLHETVELEGETDTTAYGETERYEHFTYNANKGVISGNINGDGSGVLKVYYTRNTYTLSVNNTSYGTITNSGGYKYGKEITSTASVKLLGYEFIGWYSGEELLSTDTTYTFTVDKDVMAEFVAKEEMCDFSFTSTATTCKITGLIDETVTEVVIPDYVTSIGSSAFSNGYNLTSITVDTNNTTYQSIDGNLYSKDGKTLIRYAIGKTATSFTIPDSVTSIGEDAFASCDSLTSVEIPDSVTSIGYEAFRFCSSLTSVVIPDSVTSIGSYAFYNCSRLTSVYITDIAAWCNISFGGSNANPLYYVKNLYLNNELVTELVIPDSVTSIATYAFSGYKSLTSVEIPDSVTSIGSYAFYGCRSLTEMTLPFVGASRDATGHCAVFGHIFGSTTTTSKEYFVDPVIRDATYQYYEYVKDYGTYLRYYRFYHYYIPQSIRKVTITGGTITENAFRNCTSLTSVEIGDSVTSISSYAFRYCSGLTSIEIPDSVTSIGEQAFRDCSSLTEMTIPFVGKTKDATGYQAVFGYIFGYTTTSSSSYVSGATYQYSSGITYYHYYIPTSLKKVTVTGGTIGSSAFYNCSSLTSVVIGDSVTSIGYYAFYGCDSLTEIVIPDSVTSIEWRAFYGCDSLTSIVIPDSVTSIGDCAFLGCSGLTSITVDTNNTTYQSIDGNLYSKDGKTLIQYAIGKTATSFTIPDSVTSIATYAFSGCSSLTSVVIPDSVTSIGRDAFNGCSSLTSVVIPDSVTSIGYEAFYNCSSLTSVEIPDSVTSIGNYAFEDCSSLTSVVIGDSVTSIGNYAFEDCSSLTSVYYKGTVEEWANISISHSNNSLTNANRYYYSETQPTASGNYWYYNESGNVAIW